MKSLSLRLVNRCHGQRKTEQQEMKTKKSSPVIAPWVRIVGWTSVATGTLALGYFIGRNLRARYLLNRRTPYDFYAHAGDNGNSMEYGVGI